MEVSLFLIALCAKILSVFMLQNLLTYVSCFFAVTAMCYTLYQLFRKKSHITFRKCVFMICILAVIAVPTQTMAIGKFYLFKPLYQQSVAVIANDFDGHSYSECKAQLGIPKRFLLNSCEKNAECRIYDGDYAISFTKHRNFFQWYAYVNFSETIDFDKTPVGYWLGGDYDCITWIEKDKWALVKYY